MRIDSNVFEAEGIYSALEKLGIDWGSQLELDGVDSFKKGFDSFLYSLQEKAKSLKLVSLFVGNIDSQVTETLLAKVFSSISPIEGCKLVRKEKSSYGFIHYLDRRSAASAMSFLNGKQLFGLAIKVSWANASGKSLGGRQIRCNWAAKGTGANDDKQSSDAKGVGELSNGFSAQEDKDVSGKA